MPPPDPDTDDDGIADDWELAQAGDLTTLGATGDTDHDGASDLAEYHADTGPLNPSQRLEITDFSVTTYDEDPEDIYVEIELTWTSRQACRYAIETASDPGGPWQIEDSNISADSGSTTSESFELSLESRLFLRVSASRQDGE
jgi:hypothetical protein